jgi:hypothetical protein
MFTIHSKVPFDPHLLELPGDTDPRLKEYLQRLVDVLREHAEAINGDDTWEDFVVPATAVRTPGANAPAFNDDTLTWDFSSTVNNILGFVIQLPHSWNEGTGLRFHLHVYLATAPTTNNTSRWKMEWVVYSPVGEVIPDLTVAGNWGSQFYTHTHQATARASDIIVFPEVPAIGKTVSAIMKVKVTRLPADGADTVAQVVKLDSADVHYLRNTSGSRREYVK